MIESFSPGHSGVLVGTSSWSAVFGVRKVIHHISRSPSVEVAPGVVGHCPTLRANDLIDFLYVRCFVGCKRPTLPRDGTYGESIFPLDACQLPELGRRGFAAEAGKYFPRMLGDVPEAGVSQLLLMFRFWPF